jgi:hypothetical protein
MKEHPRKADRGHISRRAFVGGAGLGAAVVARRFGGTGRRGGSPGLDHLRPGARSPANFGRMFPGLPPFAEPSDDVRAAAGAQRT